MLQLPLSVIHSLLLSSLKSLLLVMNLLIDIVDVCTLCHLLTVESGLMQTLKYWFAKMIRRSHVLSSVIYNGEYKIPLIIIKVFIHHKILFGVTILRACTGMHTHTHTRIHTVMHMYMLTMRYLMYSHLNRDWAPPPPPPPLPKQQQQRDG